MNKPGSTMWVIARASLVITVMIAMPVGENNAATQGEQGQNGNQPDDATQHVKYPQGYAWQAKTLARL